MKNNHIPDKNSPRSIELASWCLRIITFAFLLQMGLSLQLWIPITRSYPSLPFFAFLPFHYYEWLTSFFSALFLLGLCWASLSSRWRQPALLLALACFLLLVLEDANRFQPWAYVYTAFLISITWYNWRPNPKRLVATLQFIFVMVYLWSGVHKLNVQFIHDVFPWLVGIFESTRWLKEMPTFGYGMGFFEILIAAALLFPRSRRIAVFSGALLHAIILVLLIKDGWNSVVYPWNIAMPLLLYVLFWKTSDTPLLSLRNRPNWLAVGMFGLLPFLYLFHLAPNWLALSLYSGTTMECDLVVQKTGMESCFPAPLKDEIIHYKDGSRLLSLDSWGMHDLNVPPLASDATYKAVGRHFCDCAIEHQGYIILYYPQKWENIDKRVIITCEELLEEPLF
ncbi:MAG: MauE/DoxX family redox-associated membrane protein [Aureispira sp.]